MKFMEKKEGIFIGVDLGGTNIEAAAVQDSRVLASKKIKTKAHKGADAVIQRVEKISRAVMEKLDAELGDFQALCIGAPGAVVLETGVVSSAPNLDWTDVPLAAKLEERLGIPVFVDNDVNVGVAGEHAYGAGRGARHMVGVFVGTGIGGGVIINGELHYGGRGAAGEIGHMVVVPNGRLCGCGKRGCVEAYASKTAMEKALLEGIAGGQKSTLADLVDQEGQLNLTSSQIAGALDDGDELMADVLKKAQFYLALLTANLVNILDPEVIVFGGGIVEQLGDPFLQPIRETAREYYLQQTDAEQVRIVAGTLGDHAGTIGAAVVAQRRLRL
jgi:glucokinase